SSAIKSPRTVPLMEMCTASMVPSTTPPALTSTRPAKTMSPCTRPRTSKSPCPCTLPSTRPVAPKTDDMRARSSLMAGLHVDLALEAGAVGDRQAGRSDVARQSRAGEQVDALARLHVAEDGAGDAHPLSLHVGADGARRAELHRAGRLHAPEHLPVDANAGFGLEVAVDDQA